MEKNNQFKNLCLTFGHNASFEMINSTIKNNFDG